MTAELAAPLRDLAGLHGRQRVAALPRLIRAFTAALADLDDVGRRQLVELAATDLPGHIDEVTASELRDLHAQAAAGRPPRLDEVRGVALDAVRQLDPATLQLLADQIEAASQTPPPLLPAAANPSDQQPATTTPPPEPVHTPPSPPRSAPPARHDAAPSRPSHSPSPATDVTATPVTVPSPAASRARGRGDPAVRSGGATVPGGTFPDDRRDSTDVPPEAAGTEPPLPDPNPEMGVTIAARIVAAVDRCCQQPDVAASTITQLAAGWQQQRAVLQLATRSPDHPAFPALLQLLPAFARYLPAARLLSAGTLDLAQLDGLELPSWQQTQLMRRAARDRRTLHR